MALMASNYTQPVNLGNPVEHSINGTLIQHIYSINVMYTICKLL